MKWYQRLVTEQPWFKRALDPNARGTKGSLARKGSALIGAALLLFTTGHVYLHKEASRDPQHVCKTDPLRAVYKPSRLQVLLTCQTITGTVTHVSHERDGDLHIRFHTDPKWLSPVNYSAQHGDLVVEYMPSDPWPRPAVGDQLKLLCTYVADHDHGRKQPDGTVDYWHECHPVWGVQPVGETKTERVP